MLNLKRLGQDGLSMVQGLILSAVIAGSALVSTKMMTEQKATLRGVESRDQIEQLHNMIFGLLQQREHCTATLAGNMITTLPANTSRDLGQGIRARDSISPPTTKEVFSLYNVSNPNSNVYMNNGVTITSIQLVTGASAINSTAIQVTYNRLEGNNGGPRTKTGFGGKSVRKPIPLLIQRSPSTGNIESCYAMQVPGNNINQVNTVNKQFCENLGVGGSLFTWDVDTNTCIMKNNVCPVGSIFVGIQSTGNSICRPIVDYLPNLIDSSAAPGCNGTFNSVRFETTTGNQVRIRCN